MGATRTAEGRHRTIVNLGADNEEPSHALVFAALQAKVYVAAIDAAISQ